MYALYERDGGRIGELAQRTRVSPVAVLHLIEKLEAARLVVRRDCPDDNRAARVDVPRIKTRNRFPL
jgi:DNA-binding MarR family transcriptional regulator